MRAARRRQPRGHLEFPSRRALGYLAAWPESRDAGLVCSRPVAGAGRLDARPGRVRAGRRDGGSDPFERAGALHEQTYGAAETVDSRYAGSLTADTGNAALRAARGSFDDLGSYIYDTGRTNDDLYARDTIGVYVPAGSDTTRAARILREFMPVTDRALFIEEASP